MRTALSADRLLRSTRRSVVLIGSFRPGYRLQQLISGVLFDPIQHEKHEFLRQVTVRVFAGSRGPDVRAGPRELIEFCRNYPGAFCIQSKTALGGLRDFYAVLVFERRRVRNGKDVRDGVISVGFAREYDAARTVLGAMLAANARFTPPQIGITNDLTRLRKGLRHPWAIKSFRDCNEQLPQEFLPHPARQGRRR
jgi:hypothetical protein